MPARYIIATTIILFSSSLVACTSGGSNDDPGSADSSLVLNRQSFNAVADGSGTASFSFNLPAISSSFQLAANSGTLSALAGEGGNLLQQSGMISTLQRGLTSNVPYYTANSITGQVFVASYSATPGSTVGLQVFSKADVARTSGTLKLNIVLLGPVGGSEDVLSALDTALEAARITFSRAGVTLDTRISNFEGPGMAPLPGDPLYQDIVNVQRPASITVVLASEKKGTSSNEFKYGTIGTTPFPVVATANSVVIIAIQEITGSDGIFDDSEHNDEKRLLGEEIGRFTAQALGLPNIVTMKGNNAVGSDDIPDSPSCITENGCREDPSSRTNLMYPEPLEKRSQDQVIGGGTNEYYPRDQLTAQQSQVLNNCVFVD